MSLCQNQQVWSKHKRKEKRRPKAFTTINVILSQSLTVTDTQSSGTSPSKCAKRNKLSKLSNHSRKRKDHRLVDSFLSLKLRWEEHQQDEHQWDVLRKRSHLNKQDHSKYDHNKHDHNKYSLQRFRQNQVRYNRLSLNKHRLNNSKYRNHSNNNNNNKNLSNNNNSHSNNNSRDNRSRSENSYVSISGLKKVLLKSLFISMIPPFYLFLISIKIYRLWIRIVDKVSTFFIDTKIC